VAGLGTITPASGFVGPTGAVIIGAVAGVICFLATQLLKRKLHIDDSLDVSPVHGVGGIVGSVLTGVFVSTQFGGIGFAEGMTMAKQVGVQALGVVAAGAWCALATYAILKLLDATLGLRVTEEHESVGLDLAQHGERGYSE
jgi:Amt family ammonium transporter